ncbi:hypothetical protein [Pilimelia anulata]|uniref:hypothetical protein n=1 Tax=Pilimelia anulata TaxID=53371 RepID=UPI00166969CD|nr:hypothetical protein [Pilimelia anulata]
MDEDAYWRRPPAGAPDPAAAAPPPDGPSGPPTSGGYGGPPATVPVADPRVPYVVAVPVPAPAPPVDHAAVDAAEARARRFTALVALLAALVAAALVVRAWLA